MDGHENQHKDANRTKHSKNDLKEVGIEKGDDEWKQNEYDACNGQTIANNHGQLTASLLAVSCTHYLQAFNWSLSNK